MAGHYSTFDLAAVALGSGIWLPIFLSCQGILMATTPLVAHLVGASQLQATRMPLQIGLLLALVLSVIAVYLLQNSDLLLQAMAIKPELAQRTHQYLTAISWGFPALFIYQLLRCYIEGFGKTRPAMLIAALALLCNIPLNYVLIYGELGFPALGAEGCGWASNIIMWVMLFSMLFYLLRHSLFNQLHLFSQWQKPRIDTFWPFLRLGLPIGVALLIEVSMFTLIGLLLADLGETQVGAHQITISFTGLIFMLPLSLSMAMTIRVGHQLGRKNLAAASFTARCGLQLSLMIAASAACLIWLFRHDIAGLYTDDPQLLQISATLLLVAVIFQFPDALQITTSGILRGYKDTSVPLVLVFLAYWCLGLPLGYLLAKTDLLVEPMGALGFWYGLLGGLTCGAILLLARYSILRRRYVA
ncbi:MATE family efflux transporter [Pontibacter sp. JAM-7]|uniref:MATE family efflux transporter n=1 Tax=Pontibacter sp. JAM-7 TaxID=3366581 RepID=UPI003AF632E1